MSDHIGEATQKVINLDALEKLADEATPGPWSAVGGYLTVRDSEGSFSTTIYHLDEMGQAGPTQPYQAVPFARAKDAAFIAGLNPATAKALIAELKEARGLLQGFVSDEDDAVRNPLGGLSLGGLMDARDNTGCVYQSAALAARLVQTRAFLARNGKGEG